MINFKVFDYGDKELDFLIRKDPILGKEINKLGKIERRVIPDLFTALIHTIIGQQISVKAVNTIWDRMNNLCIQITPESVHKISIQKLQKCGITMKKAVWINNVSSDVVNGKIDLEALKELPDNEVVKKLVEIEGIGVWSAEMLMLNSMERPDIISYGDLAIRRGMMRLYGLTSLSKAEFREYAKMYSPHGSVASIYLWKLSV